MNETDKFTGQHRVETETVYMQKVFFDYLSASYRSVNDSYYLNLSGAGWGVGVIGKEDGFIFLLDNDSTVKVYPTGIQSYEVSTNGNYYRHQYHISKADIEMLSKHKIKSVRKYYSDAYSDMDISKKRSGQLTELSKIFLAAL